MSDIKFDCSWCGQSLEAPEDMGGEVLDCPSCKRRIKIPSATSKQTLQPKKSPPQPSRPVAPPPQHHTPPSPPPQRGPQRRQVAFICPHCNINIQRVAYPGGTVRCFTCGGSVIVPQGADTAASGAVGKSVAITIGVIICCLYLWSQFSGGGGSILGGGTEREAVSEFMRTWVSSGPDTASTKMDYRTSYSMQEVVKGLTVKSFDETKITSKGEGAKVVVATGNEYPVMTYSVPAVAAPTPFAEAGGTFLSVDIIISVSKDKKKVFAVDVEI